MLRVRSRRRCFLVGVLNGSSAAETAEVPAEWCRALAVDCRPWSHLIGRIPMNRALIRSLSVSLALLGAIPLADANDLNLLGCWRSQNADQYYSDGKVIHLNSDCVSEISFKKIRTECQNASGRVNNLSTYEITAPGRYVATLSEGSSAAKEPPQPRVVEYVVDGEWLTLTSFPQKRANAQPPAPDKVVGLAVRVNAPFGKDVCHPRGPSKIRVAAGPVSSLLLTVPETYVPVLTDPSGPFADPNLQKAINSNFLIGQFVLAGSEKAWAEGMPMPGGGYVLVVEDYRIGSRPMRPAGFRQYKASMKQEVGQDKVSCEDEKRLCFSPAFGRISSQPSQISRYLTTEFVNVKGRVAIIYGLAFGSTPEDSKAAKRSADIFAERIARDNL
jgi:hypothetical protein